MKKDYLIFNFMMGRAVERVEAAFNKAVAARDENLLQAVNMATDCLSSELEMAMEILQKDFDEEMIRMMQHGRILRKVESGIKSFEEKFISAA